MCTLTFTPMSLTGFVLSSNRDEAPNRNTLPPQEYWQEETRLLYPKDVLAGGSWIGVSEKKRVVCLLNGGFTTHDRKESYKLSRGVVVKQLLVTTNALAFIDDYNFEGIEPFTIVLIDWSVDLKLYELVWDGVKKHFAEKTLISHIWSSSLLYSKEVKKKREQWFSNFLFDNLNPSEEELQHFHKTAGEGNKEIDLVMDRGFVKTKSITQICKENDTVSMYYEDLMLTQTTTILF